MTLSRVDTYSVNSWSSRQTNDLSGRVAMASILLYEQGQRQYRGRAFFYADDSELRPPEESSTGMITLRYNICQLDTIVELLRNERPVYLYYYSQGNAGIKTGNEPVGEEEGQE